MLPHKPQFTVEDGCRKPYVEETEQLEIWISCDLCNQWCCGEYENLQSPPTTNDYFIKNVNASYCITMS